MQKGPRAHFQRAMMVVIWFGLCASAVRAQEWDPYLKGYHGPYRGRVIDAETKQHIAGAGVVAIWALMKSEFSSMIMAFYDAREAVTDSNGEFVLYAEDIENAALPQTLRPTFIIFSPGYGSFPGSQIAPQGSVGAIFEQAGTTVELHRLKTLAERLRIIGGLLPAVPEEKIPNLLRLIDIERANLKLRPPP